jgi:DMSO/TMAO reductase YedYZ molybdopterin-dependent catalytic subunit
MTLPPGQHRIDGFPRFGTHRGRPAPALPVDPVIEIGGAVTEPIALPLTVLATLPRRELTADFHCVAGWTATGLRWEGVAVEAFYRTVIEPAIRPGATITHVVFAGLDGHQSVGERHPSLPARLLRPVYRLVVPFGVFLGARGSRRGDG